MNPFILMETFSWIISISALEILCDPVFNINASLTLSKKFKNEKYCKRTLPITKKFSTKKKKKKKRKKSFIKSFQYILFLELAFSLISKDREEEKWREKANELLIMHQNVSQREIMVAALLMGTFQASPPSFCDLDRILNLFFFSFFLYLMSHKY